MINTFLTKGNSLKANDVIVAVANQRTNIKPIVIYRVLNFLVKEKVLHKVQSQNIFVLCADALCSKNNGNKIFLSCRNCKQIQEIGDKDFLKNLKKLYANNKFILMNSTIEMDGYCNNCFKQQDI